MGLLITVDERVPSLVPFRSPYCPYSPALRLVPVQSYHRVSFPMVLGLVVPVGGVSRGYPVRGWGSQCARGQLGSRLLCLPVDV